MVQAVSCDEAFLDVTDSKVENPELLALLIRKEIYETTGCTASVGIAGNMLMARIATRTAKPNGQYHITPEKVSFGVFSYSEIFVFFIILFCICGKTEVSCNSYC